MANFPGSTPSFAGFTSSHTLAQDNHAAQHNLEQGEIVALATKIGTGASTPTANTVLRGTGAGTSAFGQVDLTTDVSGQLPIASGGTGQNSLSGLTLPSATLANPAISGTVSGGATYSSPTLTTPIIADFTSATHDHTTNAEGGMLGTDSVGNSQLQSDSVTATEIDFGGSGSGVWYEEIARVTLSSAADTMDTGTFAARKYLRIIIHQVASAGGTIDSNMRFNGVSTNVYRSSYQVMAAPGTSTDTGATSSVPLESSSVTANAMSQTIVDLINFSGYSVVGHYHNTNNTAASAMTWLDGDFRYVDNGATVTSVQVINSGTGDMDIGSEIIVLGHD
jgi:hypothetical protein